jgi:hypothetical protein
MDRALRERSEDESDTQSEERIFGEQEFTNCVFVFHGKRREEMEETHTDKAFKRGCFTAARFENGKRKVEEMCAIRVEFYSEDEAFDPKSGQRRKQGHTGLKVGSESGQDVSTKQTREDGSRIRTDALSMSRVGNAAKESNASDLMLSSEDKQGILLVVSRDVDEEARERETRDEPISSSQVTDSTEEQNDFSLIREVIERLKTSPRVRGRTDRESGGWEVLKRRSASETLENITLDTDTSQARIFMKYCCFHIAYSRELEEATDEVLKMSPRKSPEKARLAVQRALRKNLGGKVNVSSGSLRKSILKGRRCNEVYSILHKHFSEPVVSVEALVSLKKDQYNELLEQLRILYNEETN